MLTWFFLITIYLGPMEDPTTPKTTMKFDHPTFTSQAACASFRQTVIQGFYPQGGQAWSATVCQQNTKS